MIIADRTIPEFVRACHGFRRGEEADSQPGEVEPGFVSADQEHGRGTEPAVLQPQSMCGLQGIGNRTDQLHCLATGPRPVRFHRIKERRCPNPFHGDVGMVVLQPKLKHS